MIQYRLCRFLVKKNPLLLCYHVVSDSPLPHIALYSYKTVKAFENDVIYLKENFNLISYEQFREYIYGEGKIRTNSVLFTFDDGLSQCFLVVRPILLKHKVPCIFFVTTELINNKHLFCEEKISLCIDTIKNINNRKIKEALYNINTISGQCIKSLGTFYKWIKTLDSSNESIIDAICNILKIDTVQYLKNQRPYLTSEEIKILASDGFTIGAHSKKHIRLDLLSESEAEKEIVDSCRIIMDLCGINRVPFAFPYHGIYICQDFLKNLKAKYNFVDLFFDTQGLKNDEDPRINRIWVDSPLFSGGNKSNIPILLLRSYIIYLKCKILINYKKFIRLRRKPRLKP